MMGQKQKRPCGDCVDGHCTTNCGPQIPVDVRGAVLSAAPTLRRTMLNAGATAPAQKRDTIDDTLDWLLERKENCIRLAGGKIGKDRDGWIEDGAFFAHAHSLIRRAYT